jgi:hypothetical protein
MAADLGDLAAFVAVARFWRATSRWPDQKT